MSRPCQEAVLGRMFEKWVLGDGTQCVEKIRYEQRARTGLQEKRMLLRYFKTHCDHDHGGMVWLKFLAALGDVPREAVEAANDVNIRMQFKEHK